MRFNGRGLLESGQRYPFEKGDYKTGLTFKPLIDYNFLVNQEHI